MLLLSSPLTAPGLEGFRERKACGALAVNQAAPPCTPCCKPSAVFVSHTPLRMQSLFAEGHRFLQEATFMLCNQREEAPAPLFCQTQRQGWFSGSGRKTGLCPPMGRR